MATVRLDVAALGESARITRRHLNMTITILESKIIHKLYVTLPKRVVLHEEYLSVGSGS